MKAEPLKDKGYNIAGVMFPAVEITELNKTKRATYKVRYKRTRILFPKEGILSAVEWLRIRSCMKRGCKYIQETSKIKADIFHGQICPPCRKLNEAFEDVIKK